MGNGDDGGVVKSQGDSSNGGDTREETVQELRVGDIQNVGGEDVAVVEDLDNGHSVGERRDVQHVEQSSLGRTDTGTGSDDLNVRDDFNGTTGNLGGDTQSLEEGGLSGFHTSVTGRNGDILGGEGTSTGRSSNLVGGDDLTDLLEVASGEDETDVTLDVGKETLERRELGEDGTEGTANHGVLTHDDDTLATEGYTDLVHLVGTDVVDIDDEDGG